MAAQRLLQPLVCKTYTPDKKSSALCVKSKDIRRRGSGSPQSRAGCSGNDTWRPIRARRGKHSFFKCSSILFSPVGHLPHAAFAATPWPHAFAKARRKAALAAVLNAGSACPRHSPCGMSTCRVFAGSGCPHGLSRLRPRLRHPWNRPCKEKKSFKGAAVIYTLPVCSLRASAAVTQATLVLRSAAQASRQRTLCLSLCSTTACLRPMTYAGIFRITAEEDAAGRQTKGDQHALKHMQGT